MLTTLGRMDGVKLPAVTSAYWKINSELHLTGIKQLSKVLVWVKKQRAFIMAYALHAGAAMLQLPLAWRHGIQLSCIAAE